MIFECRERKKRTVGSKYVQNYLFGVAEHLRWILPLSHVDDVIFDVTFGRALTKAQDDLLRWSEPHAPRIISDCSTHLAYMDSWRNG